MSGYTTSNENGLIEARNLLSQKTPDELLRLMNNEDELIKFVNSLSELQQLETAKENLKENVRCLALKNLDRDPILSEEKSKLQKLHDDIKRSQEEYKVLREKYEEYVAEMNPEMTWVLLQTAASELENQTEERANSFFSGERTEEEINDFERQFIENRSRAHELRIKAEKFRELVGGLSPSYFQ